MREARDRSAGNRQLLSATYTADGERITKSDPITGAHINSYGLHDTNRNTVYTPGVGFRAAGTDRFHHADRLGSTRALTDGAGRVSTVKSKARYSAFGQAKLQGPNGDHPIATAGVISRETRCECRTLRQSTPPHGGNRSGRG